ncbi:hypothetical protein OA45_00725 [Bacillus sp. UMTAT18]|nr:MULTISPECIES: hypothetical protein [unclassified Bacillus (in: firmicutes)]KKC57089.1 hypothetical protein OA45_00725 [Bacillus sp. UMTAT18]MDU2390360.1 hypothetical protein [Bacillus sp. (in: firmicutes)]
MMNNISKMYKYLNEDHEKNINRDAFNDISKILLECENAYLNRENVKWVCNASMGHGKTTALTCWLKRLIDDAIDTLYIPVLIAVRENSMGLEILNAINEHSEGAAVYVCAENKNEAEKITQHTQVVIISHSRLVNLALGYGNSYLYNTYTVNGEKIKRLMIIDEKPPFTSDFNMDLGKNNNGLEWFDKLAGRLNMDVLEVQANRSYIINLIREELLNKESITNALIPIEERNSRSAKRLLSTLDEMINIEENKKEVLEMRQLKLFKRLLFEDKVGRIDTYSFNGIKGRKIMISEKIQYEKLGMNVLVLDGTANITRYQYELCNYELKNVKNYNDYSRLVFHIEAIKTTKNSRENKNNAVQKAIFDRVNVLRESCSDLIVLTSKNELGIYKKLGVIEDDADLHLFNTVGKNPLKDKAAIYLTSLPKRHPDYYKSIAIGLIDSITTDMSVELSMNDEDTMNWFQDSRLEKIYKGELMAELLQIMHRTELRVIDSDKQIDVFVAYDDEDNNGFDTTKWSLSEQLNKDYFNGKSKILSKVIDNPYLHNRDKKIQEYAEAVKHELSKGNYDNEVRISQIKGVGVKFQNWLKTHWKNKKEMILNTFEKHSLTIIEKKDSYSETTKYIKIL